MNRAIVIGAYHGNAPFLDDLLTSLEDCSWPIVVGVSGAAQAPQEWGQKLRRWRERYNPVTWDPPGTSVDFLPRRQIVAVDVDCYELGIIDAVLSLTDLDEILFLQDTFEVRDVSFVSRVMSDPNSVALGPGFFHYAGKMKRSVLEQLRPFPEVRSKKESVRQEHTFTRRYWELAGDVTTFDPHFHDGEAARFEQKHGRVNMVLENEFYRKYKADWGQRPL